VRTVLERLHDLVGAVRREGVAAGPDRLQAMLLALDRLGPAGLYWAGRLTLCAGPEDIARYDAVWRRLTGAAGPVRPPVPVAPRPRLGAWLASDGDAATAEAGGRELPVAARASADEVLRHRDLAELTTAERDEVRRLLALLAPAAPRRASRRRRRAPAGPVDPARTLRATLRGLGEPVRLARHRPGWRARRLVILIDVSGSMAPYADALLRFAHAAVRLRPGSTEVFTMGTRLTRVTAPLRQRNADTAVRTAGAQVPDWRGGTRLGESLTAYLRAFGHRGMARRAVVVVCSDGWECGDARALSGAAAWLARLAHRLVWVTPHAGRPGFAPATAGLVAVRPHLDHLVAGHSLAALSELATLVGDS
jgi:hypothetical protein